MMKQHNSSDDHDRECQNKEPRKQGVNESSSSTTSTSVKDILRCRIAQKQAQQNKELVSKAQENFSLTSLSSTLSSAGYFCEVRSIVDSDLFPLPAESTAPSSSALIIEQSRNLQFSPSTGPFQPVRLIMYPHGEWRLDSPILGHRKIEDGRLSFPVKSAELVNLANKWLSNTHVLCPGLVGLDGHDLQKELGYLPKNVCLLNGTSLYSKNCKVWHVPGSNYRKSTSDRMQKICGNCLVCERYAKSALDNRQSLDPTKREERRNPSSNYPIQYLSPQSKSLRLGNSRQLRSRMDKKLRKLYKQTRVELPQEQSSELCQLIEAIENSNEGKEELARIVKEGNQYKDGKGRKAGNFVKDIWEKDRESFFKNQRDNGEFRCIANLICSTLVMLRSLYMCISAYSNLSVQPPNN